MTLATRIIPILLCRGRVLVKGSAFNSWRSIGVAAQAAKVHALRGVDELCILDIGATPEDRDPDFELVRELTDTCFAPLTIGGGIRTMQDVEKLLRAGADKVCLGTSALENAHMVWNCSQRFGSQAIVVAIDVRADGTVMSQCGTRSTGIHVSLVAFAMAAAGAGEILLTSIKREGMMQGYDLDLIKQVSEAVSIPVIANGGCGTYHDMLQAIQSGAHAVAAGAMFAFSEATPAGAAQYLSEHGIVTRQRAA